MATQPQGPEPRRVTRFVPRPTSNPRMPSPVARKAPTPPPGPAQPEAEPVIVDAPPAPAAPVAAPATDRDAQRRQEIEALRAQYGSCIWRIWARVEGGNRITFAPIYIQVDAEDRDDGTTLIRHAGRSWVFQTATVDTEVLGIERAIEERWINREDYRAFLF